MSKKNPFAAIGDAARSVSSSELTQLQPELQPEAPPELQPQLQPEPQLDQTNAVSKKTSSKGQGKRSHPNYRQTTIYIDKVLHRQLLRVLEDSGFEGDFSEWVEQKMKGEIESQEKRSQ